METKKEAKKRCNGNVTDAQIQLWKNQNKRIMEICVEDDEAIYCGYFHRPTMDTMSAVNQVGKNDEVKAATVMFDNCWLGGDDMMKEDAIIKMSALTQLSTVFNTCTASIKNL